MGDAAMKMGFAKVDVTPDVGKRDYYGLGYWNHRAVRFTGVRDRLYVRGAAIEEGGRLRFIFSVDAIFDSYGFSARAAERLAEEFSVRPEDVLIACTHAHSTPLIGFNGVAEDGSGYGKQIAEAIVGCGRAAVANMSMCRASMTRGLVRDVVRNRRPILKNGKAAELHGAIESSEVADWGPVDETMTLIRFENAAGRLLGAICHFGIHGVCVQCSDLISSDAMGRAVQEVEREGDVVILHLNGPCGDVDPIEMGGEEELNQTGKYLTAGIRALMHEAGTHLGMQIGQSEGGEYMAVRRATRPAEELNELRKRFTPADSSCGDRHHSGSGYERFLIDQELWLSGQRETVGIRWQLLRFDSVSIVGVGAEMFTRFGAELSEAVSRKIVLLVGMAGGWIGYLPYLESYEQGGYETTASPWSRVAPGETEKLQVFLKGKLTGENQVI